MKFSEINDLNYQCSIEETYPGELGLMIRKTSIYVILLPIIKLCCKSIIQLFLGSKKRNVPKNIDTVVVVGSLNQYRAVNSLIETLPNAMVISIFPIKCENNWIVDTRGNCLVSIFNLPTLLYNLFREKGFRYRSILYHFDDYLNTPGASDYAEKYLKLINPKSILVANDHTFFTRSYFRSAQKMGIKTVYIQHASVTSYFPNLEFDCAFLDGEETLFKYTGNGKRYQSDIFLSGSPRFDRIPLIPEINTFELGVAINTIDNREKIISFAETLLANNINFVLRPHPGQADINFWKQYCEDNNIGYSNPFVDSAIDFIASCKRFAVGDSAMHLEVVLCGKISYYVNFQNEVSDSYHYIKGGLVEVKKGEEIASLLKDDDVYNIQKDKVKYYVANFATDYWGKSAELIKNTIAEINSGECLKEWKLKETESKIFEIKQL